MCNLDKIAKTYPGIILPIILKVRGYELLRVYNFRLTGAANGENQNQPLVRIMSFWDFQNLPRRRYQILSLNLQFYQYSLATGSFSILSFQSSYGIQRLMYLQDCAPLNRVYESSILHLNIMYGIKRQLENSGVLFIKYKSRNSPMILD